MLPGMAEQAQNIENSDALTKFEAKLEGRIEHCMEWCDAVLSRLPETAVLIRRDVMEEISARVSEWPIYIAGTVNYLGAPCRVFLLRPPSTRDAIPPCTLTANLARQVEDVVKKDHTAGYWVWPVHVPKVAEAVIAKEMASSRNYKKCVCLNCVLRVLSIRTPPLDGMFMTTLRNHYGTNVEFAISSTSFYVQCLWGLFPVCVLYEVVYYASPRSWADVEYRVMWGCIVVWGAICARRAWWRVQKSYFPSGMTPHSIRRPRSQQPLWLRWVCFVFLALPALFCIWLCLFLIFVGVTMLLLDVIYNWGDCFHLGCRDAEMKHGFLGWLVGVACDILLVILFEILAACGGGLADWIGSLRDHEYEHEHKTLVNGILSGFAAFESLAFRGCLAFMFVPQWYPPNESNPSLLCETWMLKNWCRTQGNLDVATRRWVFERLTKGPFCVAPFVGILMKVIVPRLTHFLNISVHRRCVAKFRGCVPLRALLRFLSVIFTYDGDHVGGLFGFPLYGWPFQELKITEFHCDVSLPLGELELESDYRGPILPESTSKVVGKPPIATTVGIQAEENQEDRSFGVPLVAKEQLKEALQQFVRKEFEPESELLENQLSFMNVLFFGPMMPVGVFFTLGAKILEINFDLVKMMAVRRKVAPQSAAVLRRSLVTFMTGALFSSIGWYLALWLLTYNDRLYEWGMWGPAILLLALVWMVAGFVFSALTSESIFFNLPPEEECQLC